MEKSEFQSKTSDVKIAQALELLNEAAREKKTEVRELLTDKYSYLKQAIMEGTEQGRQIIEKAQQFAQESKGKIKETVIETDKRVHENPWPYISGAALASLILGYVFGSRRR